MVEKKREKVIFGIAIRRKRRKKENEIALVRNGDLWEFPGIKLKQDIGDKKTLGNYLTEEIFGRRVGVNQYFINSIHAESGREVHAYFATVYVNYGEEKTHVRRSEEHTSELQSH